MRLSVRIHMFSRHCFGSTDGNGNGRNQPTTLDRTRKTSKSDIPYLSPPACVHVPFLSLSLSLYCVVVHVKGRQLTGDRRTGGVVWVGLVRVQGLFDCVPSARSRVYSVRLFCCSVRLSIDLDDLRWPFSSMLLFSPYQSFVFVSWIL